MHSPLPDSTLAAPHIKMCVCVCVYAEFLCSSLTMCVNIFSLEMSHMCRSVQVQQVNSHYIYEGRFSFYLLEVDLARNSSAQDLKE